ncbi:cytosolic acyl coenzyme A thioester hydrolase-like [Parambassis ranga]|uniref:Cytosolic acyl coenzyme A thioester hydrolase-like n=1 Tax=Parambassis ranga TaxID=210632 RepID=A0A6P7IAQ4_9TELE|nr:cytosolic acyl coenzyme A thioester hydrolase-like [Parambassis ranga]
MSCFRPRSSMPDGEVYMTEAALAKRQARLQGNHAQQGSKYEFTRIMRPDDANIMGTVHGGIILKMIEEAGCIISTRHCNTQNGDSCMAALVRVESTSFIVPMFVGEVAYITAEITYASKHSLEVQVEITAENLLTGTTKQANKAVLWYVPWKMKNVEKITEVPPIKYASAEDEEEGRKRYEAQKMERQESKAVIAEMAPPSPNPEPHTVGFSQSTLIHLVGPSDCSVHDYAYGGESVFLSLVLLLKILEVLPSSKPWSDSQKQQKWMDEGCKNE